MSKFYFWILKILGWDIDRSTPISVKKAVVVMAPHTSNWDFVIGFIAFKYYGVNAKFLIKKELFFFPLGFLLKRMGGVPVDRKQKNNITEFAVDYFNKNESCYMIFTPEGTRSYNPNWKKGFYYIAQNAKVPIYIGYLDYKKKKGGFYSKFEPTGNIEKDFQDLKKIFVQFSGRFPENGVRPEEILDKDSVNNP